MINDHVKVCSQSYRLDAYPDETGGQFNIVGDNGNGWIRVGTQRSDPACILDTLIHEVLESILTTDGKRYHEIHNDIMFVFDHNYLDALPFKLMDALISCGAIELPERYRFKSVQETGEGRAWDEWNVSGEKGHSGRS